MSHIPSTRQRIRRRGDAGADDAPLLTKPWPQQQKNYAARITRRWGYWEILALGLEEITGRRRDQSTNRATTPILGLTENSDLRLIPWQPGQAKTCGLM